MACLMKALIGLFLFLTALDDCSYTMLDQHQKQTVDIIIEIVSNSSSTNYSCVCGLWNIHCWDLIRLKHRITVA
ncbi:hypothetical protein AAHE18_03G143300 [Arachis hypogaea]